MTEQTISAKKAESQRQCPICLQHFWAAISSPPGLACALHDMRKPQPKEEEKKRRNG